jgi:hypothetical protein
MKLTALIAALALIGACATPPDPDHRPTSAEIQPLPFSSQHGLYLKVVDDGASMLHKLFDNVPPDPSDKVKRVVSHVSPATTDIYLTAPTRDSLVKYVATLTVPQDREIALGGLAADQWRPYVVFPESELDATSIAHAEAMRDPNTNAPAVMLDLTEAGGKRLAELTARVLNHRLAVLVDGSVVSAPVVRGTITGGRAEVSFTHGTDADARALVQELALP